MANSASPHNADQPLFIEEVQGHQARYTKVIELTHSATKAAGVMLLAAIAALAIANSGIYGQFEHLIHTQIGFVVGDSISTMSIAHIINDILTGVRKADGAYVTIPDRKEAIRYCMEHGREGDVIILAGKGHEDYQEIRGVKHHMDERELIADIIAGK